MVQVRAEKEARQQEDGIAQRPGGRLKGARLDEVLGDLNVRSSVVESGETAKRLHATPRQATEDNDLDNRQDAQQKKTVLPKRSP